MKINNDRNHHLTYCTNVHSGETWPQVYANLKQYLPSLKARLSPNAPFGVGLRLSDLAARELLAQQNLERFKFWLAEQDLYVFTLNGFPYGNFHHSIIKDRVYAPDWIEQDRLNYTQRLLKILSVLLPKGIEGSISTLPLSYKPWWQDNQVALGKLLTASSLHLAQLTAQMNDIEQDTGKILHLDLEPEPDGLIENGTEVINFFKDWLWPIGRKYLAFNRGITLSKAEDLLRKHIRICYDTCHFAVEYEDPATVFRRFQSHGINIGKIQLSAAVKVDLTKSDRHQIHERLRPFAESTYLHQVIEQWEDGTLHHYPDLIVALLELERSPACEWRTHFHVPIFIENYQLLQSTQDHIVQVLQLLETFSTCCHLEIETYTWDVLPAPMKLDLFTSIEREYRWVLQKMSEIGETKKFALQSVER